MSDHFISEMAQKAAAAKRVEKVQREAALEAVKMAKRERGVYEIHILMVAGIAFKNFESFKILLCGHGNIILKI